jgi:hypothetical protein
MIFSHSPINAIQGGKPLQLAPVSAFLHTVRGYSPGGFMDILAALRQEEAKREKEVSAAQQQLDNVRAAIKLLGGMNGSAKTTANSSAKTTASSSVKMTGGKKRVMSAAARAKMAKAQKERWAKFRAAKAKGKQ